MKIGRPTVYRKSFVERAQKLWAKGSTDEEVCKALKITHQTLHNYQKRYPDFLEAKVRGKAIADQLVEHALFKRATGFIAPDCHVSQWEGEITITDLEKHYPPDTAAIVFWLKNRKPKEWRDKTELTVSDEVAGVPSEFLDAFRKRFLQSVAHTNGNGNGH